MLLEEIKELYKYREIIVALTSREIKSRYKQSVIGIFWAIIQPFALMVIFTMVFSLFFQIKTTNSVPYPIFIYSTLVPWIFFSKTLLNSSKSIVNNYQLVTKIYFPKEILTLSIILANIIDLLISSTILLLMMIFYQVGFSLYLFYIIPLFFIELILVSAISFFLAAANVFLRDIENGIGLVVQVWMFATPVVYSTDKVPEKYLNLYNIINPIAPIIEGYRHVIVESSAPDLFYISISFLISIVLLILSYIYFKKSELVFADLI